MGVVDEPCRPILCSSLPELKPGSPRSTMNAVKCSPSTFAKMMKRSAKPPLLIHIFSPLSDQLPSGSFVARVFAASASEPEPDSLRAYAPISSPVIRRGRYVCFCSVVPKSTSGRMLRFACPPNVVANEADGPIRSTTARDEALSRSSPPYSSGTAMLSSPSSPHRRTSERANCQSLLSSRSRLGKTSLSTNSVVVLAISLCSSESFSGGKTSEEGGSSSSHEPPLREKDVEGVAVVIAVQRLQRRP